MPTTISSSVKIGLVRERVRGERRVALTPAGVNRLSAKAAVIVEIEAGAETGFSDEAYAEAGARLAH